MCHSFWRLKSGKIKSVPLIDQDCRSEIYACMRQTRQLVFKRAALMSIAPYNGKHITVVIGKADRPDGAQKLLSMGVNSAVVS